MDVGAIVSAIIHVESRGNPSAVSRDGCVGLMQVHPRWAKGKNLLDPAVNRAEGIRLLRYWHRHSGGSWLLTLAAYRCGWGGLSGKCGKTYAQIVLRRATR